MHQDRQILYKRYARALLSLAVEHDIPDRSYVDMKFISQSLESNSELVIFLKSPVIPASRKQNVIRKVFGRQLHQLFLQYLLIIVRKQRGHMLDGIARAYLTVYKQYRGIETVRITTAVPLDNALREQALKAARRLTSRRIEFEESVDPDVIGGFILDLEDRRYDASIKRKLSRARSYLHIDKTDLYV